MTALSFGWILERSLCRPAHCSEADTDTRREQIEYIETASGYAEPGYTDTPKGVLFGNWNYFASDVTAILERAGYDCQWSDEWTTCSECGKALRTQADSYGCQPSYFDAQYGYLCRECVDVEEYLETLEDNPDKALNDHIDPAEYGYEKVEGDFENGFHHGQNADPKSIFARHKERGCKRLLFVIDCVGQFDINFSVWQKVTETQEE